MWMATSSAGRTQPEQEAEEELRVQLGLLALRVLQEPVVRVDQPDLLERPE